MNYTDNYLDYPKLVDLSMRRLAHDILEIVSKNGISADNHFLISFVTTHPDVVLSDRIKKKYPKEMTIVLQYMFDDLDVNEDHFSVTLSFDSISENIRIPFDSLTAFVDPSTKFALQFEYYTPEFTQAKKSSSSKKNVQKKELNEDSKVIDLAKFRKSK